jgi:hypothetical protein
MQAGLPENVLVIHYAALAPGAAPLVRLQVLAAIGRLLAMSEHGMDVPHPYALDALLTDEQARTALRAWLAGEEARRFWQVESDQVTSRRPCDKHVLVGTRQMMGDLASLAFEPGRPQLADLDRLWQAAAMFAEQCTGQTGDVSGVENG